MKKILLILFTFLSVSAFGQEPALEMLIFPKYIEGNNLTASRNGIPYVYRARITGLKQNRVYRYENKVAATTVGTASYMYILPPDNVKAGTAGYVPGNFYKSPVLPVGDRNGSNASFISQYGEFTSDSNGTYTGWFIQETSRSYLAGSKVLLRISLNDPDNADLTAIAYRLHSPADQPLTVITMDALENTTGPVYGTAIRSTAATGAAAKNLVFLYDNENGTGRPIAGTFIEDDGANSTSATAVSKAGYSPFYYNNVNGVDKTWGAMVLNSDVNGIRRIERRSLETGEVLGYNTSPDGSWADGENTGTKVSTALTKKGVNIDGTLSIVIDGTVVTLGAVKSPQTVTFTNTFPSGYKVGDPDFTLSASSTAGLTGFQYTVAPAGILTITGNTVKIIGGGTAVITVTEPGNANFESASATQSITVSATAQVISGLSGTIPATYGDANLELTATGGASGNPVTYTSDDVSIAEIVDGNKLKFNKGGTVIIRANQAGNANYSAATEVTVAVTVAKASLDVIAEDKVKVQGAANPVASFRYGTFKGSDDASSVTGTPVLTIAADESSPAALYDITVDVSGLSSDKYVFNPVKGQLKVEAKLEQIITVVNFPANTTYGSQALPFQISSNSTNEITFKSSRPDIALVEKNTVGEWTVKILGAGEVDITATQPEDAQYVAGTIIKHIGISKAALSVTADDKAKLTGEPDPVFTARYSGFVNNDDESKLSGTLVFNKQADGAGYLIIPSGLTSENYTIDFVNGRLTESSVAFAPMNKIYGDIAFDPGARNGLSTVTYTVANTAVAVVNPAGLIEIKGAGSTQATASFSSGATTSATLTVAKKDIIVTPVTVAKVYGQANPVFTAGYAGLVNGETEGVFSTLPQIATTADATSGAARYVVTASGASAANYNFSYRTGLLEITKAPLTVKANDLTKIYGQVNPVLTLIGNGLVLQDKLENLFLNLITTTSATVGSGVGAYPVTVTGLPEIANYTLSYQSGSLSVQPASLMIKAVDAERPQGQANPVFTFTYQGFVNGDAASVLSSPPVAATTATITSVKGAYPITVSGAAAANYTITYQNGQLFVKGLPVINYNGFPVLTYGDANFAPAANADSGAQPVFSSDNTNVATIENGRVKIISAGTANIIASFPATADYVATTASKQLVVAKRTILVRADSKTKLYGQSNPVLTATYDGFVNGETLASAISAPALLTTTATPLSPVGTYTISGSAGSALNYTFIYETGILTVDKAILTVTADNKTRAFGLENPAFTFRYTGFVSAENEAVIQNPALASTTASLSSPAGTYPISLSGATDKNYNFNYVSGILTVTATTRTITMDAIALKFVGDADFVPVVTLSSAEAPVFSSSDVSIATVVDNKIHIVGPGNVTITATAPVNSSYSSNPSVSRLLVVNKVAQTITFEAIPVIKPDGTGYTLKAVSSSGLPVTFATADPLHVSLNGDIIKGLRIGKVQISASQPGNNQYAAAKIAVQVAEVADAAGDGVKVHPALSLNGDGVNEFLTIDGIKDYPLNKVTIINRNGIKVFDIEGYDNDAHVFSGKSKSGALLPQGTYFCLIEYNIDTQLKRKTGYFILKY